MGLPICRFTLSHAVLGSRVISEPDGWKDAILKLERHEDFHSLLEFFEGTFIFYGSNGVDDGGIDFIKNVENVYGFDATLNITIEISFDAVTYQQVFNGLLDLSELQEVKDNKMEVPIIRNDFWSKFKSRIETPVNIKSATSLDGTAVDVIDNITLNLTNQKIRYNGEYRWDESVTYVEDTQLGFQLDWDKTITDDLAKFTLPRVKVDTISPIGAEVAPIFEAPWDGLYTFDIRYEVSDLAAGPVWGTPTWNTYISKLDDWDNQQQFTETTVTYGSDAVSVREFLGSMILKKGDQVVIYGDGSDDGDDDTVFGETRWDYKLTCELATTGNITLSGEQTIDGVLTTTSIVLVKDQANQAENGAYVSGPGAWVRTVDLNTAAEFLLAAEYVSSGDINAGTAWKQTGVVNTLGVDAVVWEFLPVSDERFRPYPGTTPDCHLIITADTTFADTTCQAFLLHDAAGSILDRIIGQNDTFYSEFFGSTVTNYRTYDASGCGWRNALSLGLHIKGYTLTEKLIFLSFDKWWKGTNPMFNLSLGYETINGVEVIRIEEKDHQYDQTSVSVYIDNVRDIIREYDPSRIFKKIDIGYSKWQSEQISGIDDPQTKHTYATRFEKVGTDLTLYSEFIGASLAWEIMRRKSFEKSKDYKYDDDVFVVCLNGTPVSADVYVPELDENFNSITNLLNSDTRYNSIHTPMRMLLRWGNYFTGALQKYVTSDSFRFVSAEGNYDMRSDYSCSTGGQCIAVICDDIGESENISLGAPGNYNSVIGYIHLPEKYTINIDLSWDDYAAIRNNRKKAIAVSQTETNHKKYFIKELEYSVCLSKAKIVMWAAEPGGLVIPNPDQRQIEC